MILSVVSIVVILLISYMWASRGFFSALLHMACVVVAGAIAFALWEPVAYALLKTGKQTLIDVSWGLGLALPFAVTLAVLRLSLDAVVRKNTDLDGVANLVGGGLCGAVSGFLTTGVLVLSLLSMRGAPELMGYRPIVYNKDGSLVRESNLILPVDVLTAKFYTALSGSTFYPTESGGETLGKWRPNLADEGPLLRTSYAGKAKTVLAPGSFELLSRYRFEPKNPAELLSDTFGSVKSQSVTTLDGQPVSPANSVVEGFSVKFLAGAKEKAGPVLVGNGQVRLVVQTNQNDPESTVGIQPFAMVSQAQGDQTANGRWRFDGDGVFIPSVGGRDDAPMAFEFLVPKGASPVALYVKGVRVDLAGTEAVTTYTSVADRDAAIRAGRIPGETSLLGIVTTGMIKVPTKTWALGGGGEPPPVRVTDGFTSGTYTIQKDALKGLQIDETNRIIDGEAKFSRAEVTNRGIDRALAVRRFATTDDTSVVQVTVDSSNKTFGLLSDVAANIDGAGTPLLFDTNNAAYSPVGYMYENGQEVWIRFTPQTPVKSIDELRGAGIAITRSQPNAKLVLIYRMSKNVGVYRFAIGKQVIAEFDPPVPTGQK